MKKISVLKYKVTDLFIKSSSQKNKGLGPAVMVTVEDEADES